jgi:hypothetical protein
MEILDNIQGISVLGIVPNGDDIEAHFQGYLSSPEGRFASYLAEQDRYA